MTRGRDKFNKYKKLIEFITFIVKLLPRKSRVFLFESSRNFKGVVGMGIRYILIKSIAKKCGDNVSIHPGVYIFNTENLEIGSHVSIHPMSYIEPGSDTKEGIVIGKNVSIAHSVTIMATNHNYESIDVPIKDQGVTTKKVIIEENVWIGAKVTILSGRNIGCGSIIASNSVVTKDILQYTIVGGIPSKLIKSRI